MITDTLAQLAGRLHPMVLHVPIGLLVGLVGVEVVQALRGRPVPRELRGPVVWLAAVSACCAVGSGLLLARETDPTAAVVRLHKWMGIAVAAGCVLAAVAQPRGGGGRVYRFAMIVSFGALVA